jgi:hypothetical protein
MTNHESTGPAQRLNVAQVAATSQRHPVTVRLDLEAGKLHGSQSVKGGRWLVRVECLDAFLDGVKCEHQAAAAKPDRHLTVVTPRGGRARS